MNNDNTTQSAPTTLLPSELLTKTTELCNELEEVMVLHHFFFQACEHFFEDKGLSFRRGLSLFPSWLRERDLNAMERLHEIQDGLRVAVME